MSRHIVKQINKTVAYDDELWCLGDWSFQGVDNIWNFRKQIICKNLHILYGNHDQHIKNNAEIGIPKEDWGTLEYLEIPYDPYKQFNNKRYLRTRDLFSSTDWVSEIKFGKHSFYNCHCKHAIWPGSHKGVIHLYGHSHGHAEDWIIGKSMDVGLDNAYKLLGEYRPFSMEEIIQYMSSRDVHQKDHHGEKEN